MKARFSIGLVLGGLVIAAFVYMNSEFTNCFAGFDSRVAAERAAKAADAIGFDTEIEPSGPDERKPTSRGAREIAVTFSTGETGDDAADLREGFRQIVNQETGTLGHPGGGCLERQHFD